MIYKNFIFLCAMLSGSLEGNCTEVSSLETTKISTKVENQENYEDKWDIKAAEVAKSWGESLEEFKKEARNFLREYRKENPYQSCPESIKELIMLKKEACIFHGELKKNHNFSQQKFLIPSSY